MAVKLKGANAVRRGRVYVMALLTAAALTAYTLTGLQAAGAETERRASARDALEALARSLEEENDELRQLLDRSRADKASAIEALARERLGLAYPDGAPAR